VRLARRFVRSGLWAGGAQAIAVAILAVRSVLLARLLPVDVFGVYAFAAALTTLTAVIARFGMDDALVHRAPETEDADAAAAVHFTLAALFAAAWMAMMLVFAWTFHEGALLTALAVLTGTQAAVLLSATPTALLRRRVDTRLLAAIGLAATALSSIVGLALAWGGYGLWSLLMIDAVAALLGLGALLILGPGWRPRWRWDPRTVRYFLGFGSRNVLGRVLEDALQKVDRLWTGSVLGPQALGLYARAVAYSRAPIGLADRPVASIVIGAYAELARDRGRLSGALMRIAELLVNASALIAVTVGLAAPELIVLLVGAKWLPMLDAFRILLLAAVPAALIRTFVQLLVAVGAPGARVRIAALRLAILVLGILALGPTLGITGVGLAVLISAVSGLALALPYVGRFADVSLGTLLVPPVLAAMAAVLAGTLTGRFLPPDSGLWARMFWQVAAAVAGYGAVLALLRGRHVSGHLRIILRELRSEAESGQR
jgi:O-antigen/teichoic acid export membrane protein